MTLIFQILLLVLFCNSCSDSFCVRSSVRKPASPIPYGSRFLPAAAWANGETSPDDFSDNDTAMLTFDAYVVKKRRYGKRFTFVDFEQNEGGIHPCLLRGQTYPLEQIDRHSRCLQKGSKWRVTGYHVLGPNGQKRIDVSSLHLLALPRDVLFISNMLKSVQEGNLPLEDVARACSWSPMDLRERLNDAGKPLRLLSEEVLASLPNDSDHRVPPHVGTALLKIPREWASACRSQIPIATGSSAAADMKTVRDAYTTENLHKVISVSGWVKARQKFEDEVLVIRVVDDLTDTDRQVQILCVIHPTLLQASSETHRSLVARGCKVSVEGQLLPDKTHGTVLWIYHMRLLQSSSASSSVLSLLKLLSTDKFDAKEASEALMISHHEAILLSRSTDETEQKRKANELAFILQSRSHRPTRSRKTRQVLGKYNQACRRNPIISTDIQEQTSLLRSGRSGSWYAAKKKYQIEWMGEQIREVLQSHPDFGKRKLSILDIGGSKGLLANYLGQAIEEVTIRVVDIRKSSIGLQNAKRLNIPVEFQVADASGLMEDIEADVVIALHACGHLSDVALAHAVQRRAGFVICPCCFNSNPNLTIPQTDGQAVSEWLGLPREDWAALKLLAEGQIDAQVAREAIAAVCAVRATAAKEKLSNGPNKERAIEIRSFPIQYSTRNMVLVGMCS